MKETLQLGKMNSTKRRLELEMTKKQYEVAKLYQDKVTTEILFGGGAGGGKSFLLCVLLIDCCLSFDESRYLLGRSQLKNLKESTLQTFFQVAVKIFKLKSGDDYKYNGQDNHITFYNGSQVFLKDLATKPSDPEFDSLGSTEFTGAFIDEANQISEKAKNIVLSRIRYKIDEFGIIPKLMMTCNPDKNSYLHREFYAPYRDGKLTIDKAFVPALVTDNPHMTKYYIDNLKKFDKITVERLLYGNWDYDDDDLTLFKYDEVNNLFTNIKPIGEDYYITCDVATTGKDRAVIFIWQGWELIKYKTFAKSTLKELENYIERQRTQYNIPKARVLVDDGGVGTGLREYGGYLAFISNQKPIQTNPNIPNNYANIKAQCVDFCANKVNDNEVLISCNMLVEDKQLLIEDLMSFERYKAENDTKFMILPKDKQKEKLGRSPDMGDAFIMRAYFGLRVIRPLHKLNDRYLALLPKKQI